MNRAAEAEGRDRSSLLHVMTLSVPKLLGAAVAPGSPGKHVLTKAPRDTTETKTRDKKTLSNVCCGSACEQEHHIYVLACIYIQHG